jgi:F-type H+-transporting ATPase subunit b
MTLIGQTIAMIVFVWFCMKFIWPPLLEAIELLLTRDKSRLRKPK